MIKDMFWATCISISVVSAVNVLLWVWGAPVAFALFEQVLAWRQGCAAASKLCVRLFCFPRGKLALFANVLLA
jgi:hypothetical protein